MPEHSTHLPVLQSPGDLSSTEFGGGSIAVRLRREQTAGRLGMIENAIPPDFNALPWHVHPAFDETFVVLDGTLRFSVGEQRLEAGPGSVVHVPGGTPHRFTEEAGQPARLLILATPGGHERYFERLAELYRQSGPDGPAAIDLGALMEAEGVAVVPPPDAVPSQRAPDPPRR
jgi:quercetin dioxygenase-like cupin family protein